MKIGPFDLGFSIFTSSKKSNLFLFCFHFLLNKKNKRTNTRTRLPRRSPGRLRSEHRRDRRRSFAAADATTALHGATRAKKIVTRAELEVEREVENAKLLHRREVLSDPLLSRLLVRRHGLAASRRSGGGKARVSQSRHCQSSDLLSLSLSLRGF